MKRSALVVMLEMSAKSSMIRVKPTKMKTRPIFKFKFGMFTVNRLRREKDMKVMNKVDAVKIASP
jgi:hypothetical protein